MTDLPNSDLAMTVEGRDGILKRWGPDELDGRDVPMALQFGTATPNGFQSLTSSLLREITRDFSDQQLLGDVTVYGPGQEIVWQGRMTQFPREHGDDFNITPSAVGWAAHLLDDPQFTEIYVDADVTKWGGMPFNRQVEVATAGQDYSIASWQNGQGGMVLAFPNQAIPAGSQRWETWYIAPVGATVMSIKYLGSVQGSPPTGFGTVPLSGVDQDNLSVSGESANLSLNGVLNTVTYGTARRYNAIRVGGTGTSAATPTAGSSYTISKIAAYGSHGLTTQAIDSSTPNGIYLSDIVENIVSRGAPLLDTTDIDTNTVIVPHFVVDHQTPSDALLALNNYAQWDWGVYDNKRFFFRAPDPDRLTWTVRLDEGTGLELEGEEADNAYNGVFVTFTDTGGIARAYGPTGTNADYTDSSLQDTSTDNVVNQAGIPRKLYPLSVPGVTTPAGALTIGQAKMAELALPTRRGSVTVKGYAHHPTAGLRPAWAIRAGDFVRVEDHPADVARRVIETSYDHSTRINTLTVGNTSLKVDALMEYMQAAIVGLGGG